jgi:hypothetical protein
MQHTPAIFWGKALPTLSPTCFKACWQAALCRLPALHCHQRRRAFSPCQHFAGIMTVSNLLFGRLHSTIALLALLASKDKSWLVFCTYGPSDAVINQTWKMTAIKITDFS